MPVRIDDYIGKVPDFPKPGILFYDISPLLAVPDVWEDAIDQLSKLIIPFQPTLLAAIDSRGFLVASPLALKIRCGLIMIRKMGKLPGITIKQEYSLEYGEDSLEIRDGIKSINVKGVCSESQWPYNISKFTDKPPEQCYKDAVKHKSLLYRRIDQSLMQLKSALFAGFPVVFGFFVFESFESQSVADSGMMPIPEPTETPTLIFFSSGKLSIPESLIAKSDAIIPY